MNYRIVFCEAYKIGLYGDKIQWLIVGGFTNHWWKRPNLVNCTHEQVEKNAKKTFYWWGVIRFLALF